jgi:hypothetical protein
MYHDVVERIWPAVCLGGLAAFFVRSKPLIIAVLLLGLCFAIAPFLQAWNFSRALVLAVILLQLWAGAGAGALIQAVARKQKDSSAREVRALCLFLVFTLFLVEAYGLGATIYGTPVRDSPFRELSFLRTKVQSGETVAATPQASLTLPALGLKVVAIELYSPLFGADYEKRLAELTEFYSPQSTTDQRVAFLRRYHVRFVLLEHDDLLWAGKATDLFGATARVIYESDFRRVIEVRVGE